MIAVDTNILVYAHRADSAWYKESFQLMRTLAEGEKPWAIPAPCLHEFIGVVTNLRVYRPPSTLEQAFDQLEAWIQSSAVTVISESTRHWQTLRRIAEPAKLSGSAIHDARVAAICLDHGASVLWTSDRDFSRFKELRTTNPLVGR